MNYGVRSLALETSLFQAHYAPTVWSLFADDRWRAAGWLLLPPGARLDYVTGPDQAFVSPRISFRTFLSPTDAIQGSVGRYHQAIHSIRDQEIPVTIFEFWIGGTATSRWGGRTTSCSATSAGSGGTSSSRSRATARPSRTW